MRSVFNRKSKTKSPESPTAESNGKPITPSTPTEVSVATSVDTNPNGTDKSVSSLRIPLRVDGTATSLRSKTSSPQTELNPAHFSSTAPLRRNGGVSVTFESTLPTQVWQASPNPSPPPPGDAGPGQEGSNSTVANENWPTTLFLADTEDSSSSSDVEDVHNSVSFRSALSTSTCSSSDSGSICREIRERRTTKAITDTRYTRQPSPDLSHSNSSLEIHRESRLEKGSKSNPDSSDGSKLQFLHRTRNSRPVNSVDRDSVHERRRKHRKRNREGGGKAVGHPDNPTTLRSSSSNSSSTSSSGMEEMEALGWDDKSIAQLTRRTANSRRNKPTAKLKVQSQEKTQLQPLPSSAASLNNKKAVLSPFTPRQSSEITRCEKTTELQASSLFQSVNMEPPHSSLLVRKNRYNNNSSTIDGCADYLVRQRLSQSPPAKPPSPQASMLPSLTNYQTASGGIQRLAIVISDYRPCTEWEQNHHVMAVHRGDYVCVLSQGLSRNSTKYQRFMLDASNTWIYVRRWCTDHLAATGPPGFVPQHFCRLLTSSEIIHLWQHTCQVASGLVALSAPKNNKYPLKLKSENELKTSLHFVSNSPVSPNLATVMNRSPSNLKDKGAQSSTTVHPILESRAQHLVQLNNCSLPSPETSRMIKSHRLKKMLQVLPPPPSGFGSGGSIGSETEDRDSGRGPSSGSEWGSGKGGSSNVTLDRNALAEKTFSDAGLEHHGVHQCDTGRTCDTKIPEECQFRWNIPNFSQWPNEEQIEECYSPELEDSALPSPCSSNAILQSPATTIAPSHTDHGEGNAVMTTMATDNYSHVTLTTRTNYTPVLELRSTGIAPPTFYARYDVNQAAEKRKETKTIDVVRDQPSHPTMSSQAGATVAKLSTPPLHESEQAAAEGLERLVTSAANTVDPSYWEPYQTVLHVNENSLEKFTLV